jgi:NADPH:quinone reductase-like Zn-dependent oxidoreductase
MSTETTETKHANNLDRYPIPKNEAAWLTAEHGSLEVKEAPYTQPAAGEILVRNHAVAVNPVDWMIPYLGKRLFAWIKYPFILGSDLAGEVTAIGGGITNVKVGDRVLAFAAGTAKQRNRAVESAFQVYTIVSPHLVTNIPDNMPYAEAAVVPLGITTAACGLFQSDALSLKRPSADAEPTGQWVLISGGATSVGSNAIQLAVAAGYSVVTTASPKNFEFVKSLGAAHVFDYKSKDIVRNIVAVLKGKDVAGALSIAAGSTPACIDILAQCKGRKFVANISSPISFESLPNGKKMTLPVVLKLAPGLLKSSIQIWFKSQRHKITVKFFDASSMIDNDLSRYIYQDFLGNALAMQTFRPSPPPMIAGSSLHDIQKAFDIQRSGVSAAKVVVTLA